MKSNPVGQHPLSSDEAAQAKGQAWVDAWNSHDINRIMAFYAEPLKFYSPLIVLRTGDKSGCISDVESLRAYFSKGLAERPDLRFEFEAAFRGVTSVAVLYQNPRGRAVEVMSFDDAGRVIETRVHYLPGLL